ncbi:MAG: protein adenylyltransferase SelO [Janthinobacterium lividum]
MTSFESAAAQHLSESEDAAASPARAPSAVPVQPAAPWSGPALSQALPGSFFALGDEFARRVAPSALPEPYLVAFAADAAQMLGMPPHSAPDQAFIERFAGSAAQDRDAAARPVASVYSGHQFGVWAGQLGDGRALLLGEATIHAPGLAGKRETDGASSVELQLKGAGMTPFSRMADGRAVLRSSIREFLCSEAMHHLGVPTTRALSVTGSDQPVRRETVETAAVVARFAPSFVRFGHFEHFAALERPDLLRRLVDHVVERHLPPAAREADDRALALLEYTALRTAEMIAHWQSLGFCHGVMNTDNMSILGLTIDYGPFGFMDGFDVHHICNHSDSEGRYAFRAQPQIAQWNLIRLAQALLPIIDGGTSDNAASDGAGAAGSASADAAEQADNGDGAERDRAVLRARTALEGFKPRFLEHYGALMRAKVGFTEHQEGDEALIEGLLAVMHAQRADFTLTFRRLANISRRGESYDTVGVGPANAPARDLFLDRAAFNHWASAYRQRLDRQAIDDATRAASMRRANPKFVLRNHLAETAIAAAREKDFSVTQTLLEVLQHPFDEQPEHDAYAALPPEWASSLEVSCSS